MGGEFGELPAEWQAVGKVWLLLVDKAGCIGAAKTQGSARMNEAWWEWEGVCGEECCGGGGNVCLEHQYKSSQAVLACKGAGRLLSLALGSILWHAPLSHSLLEVRTH